ncbi:MAG: dephospho-CoA kinase [Paracoccaceae bacterium]
MSKNPKIILGLTGSIAMGKTTVSNMFRDIGVPVWCADKEVNFLYSKDGEATKIFTKEFPNVVTETGIDKVQLRNLIHEDNAVLRKVEEIVHPLLQKSKDYFMKLNKKASIVIFDIPLLLEKNQERKFDAVIVVTASEMTQKSRVLKRKNMAEKDFLLIKRNQLSEKEKLKRADFIINTDKALLDTKQEVQELYKRFKDLKD